MQAMNHLLSHKIVAIIRGFNTHDALPIAHALYQGGIRVLEVAMNSPQPLQTIEKIYQELGEDVMVGAGTVLDAETARLAILAGAQFIFSPIFDADTIKLTKRYGMISIPAAYTPTEIMQAFSLGGDIIKIFPASTLGPSYLKDVLAPLPQLKLLPTGGVNLDNIADYLKSGAIGVGLGGALVNKTNKVDSNYLSQLTRKAQQFIDKVNKMN